MASGEQDGPLGQRLAAEFSAAAWDILYTRKVEEDEEEVKVEAEVPRSEEEEMEEAYEAEVNEVRAQAGVGKNQVEAGVEEVAMTSTTPGSSAVGAQPGSSVDGMRSAQHRKRGAPWRTCQLCKNFTYINKHWWNVQKGWCLSCSNTIPSISDWAQDTWRKRRRQRL